MAILIRIIMFIYIDIETIPCQIYEEKKRLAETIQPPGNYTKPDTIAKWMREKAPEALEKRWLTTALDPTWGEIVCICFAIDDGELYQLLADQSERDVLKDFWTIIKDECFAPGRPQVPVWVGHHVIFDLRFIHHRSIIHGVPMAPHLPINHPPHSGLYHDTMWQWCGKDTIKLSDLCRALNIPHDTQRSGADVWDLWSTGKGEEVLAHCRLDLGATREVHRRLHGIPSGD